MYKRYLLCLYTDWFSLLDNTGVPEASGTMVTWKDFIHHFLLKFHQKSFWFFPPSKEKPAHLKTQKHRVPALYLYWLHTLLLNYWHISECFSPFTNWVTYNVYSTKLSLKMASWRQWLYRTLNASVHSLLWHLSLCFSDVHIKALLNQQVWWFPHSPFFGSLQKTTFIFYWGPY